MGVKKKKSCKEEGKSQNELLEESAGFRMSGVSGVSGVSGASGVSGLSRQLRGTRNSRVSKASSQVSEQNHNQPSIKSQDEVKQEESLAANSESLHEKHEPMIPQQRLDNSVSNPHQMIPEIKREKEEEDITQGSQIIDLNRYLFNGIVQLCRLEQLISEDMAHSFLTNHSMSIDKSYISKYRANELERFNFSLCQISLMDHRRLVDMLLTHNPEKYVPLRQPEQPYDFLRETQEFLRDLYQMSERDYRRELDEQVIKYYQYWWGGPERIDPMIDPAVKFYETEDGQRIREERENAIQIETIEQEKERNKRVNTDKTTNQDLKTIAEQLTFKLYGSKADVKLEPVASAGSSSAGDDSERMKTRKTADKKEKKVKKERKDKKSKRSKSKKSKKSKKHSKEKDDEDDNEKDKQNALEKEAKREDEGALPPLPMELPSNHNDFI